VRVHPAVLAEHHVLREDFYYRTETLIALAERHGLAAQFMADWEQLPHGQSKIRVTHRSDGDHGELEHGRPARSRPGRPG